MLLLYFHRYPLPSASGPHAPCSPAMVGAAAHAFVLAALLLMNAAAGGAEDETGELKFRTWTDASGTHKTEAAFLRYERDGGNVHLQKKDGGTLAVPMDRLSRKDQSYVKQELSRRAVRRRSGRDKGGLQPMTDKDGLDPKSDKDGLDRKTSPRQLGAANSAEWPGWRGPNRDGKSPDTGLLKEWPADGPKLLWKATGIGKGFSSVAVSGQTIYTTGDLGDQLVVFATDLDGKAVWKAPFGQAWTANSPGSRSTPTIDAGNLYLVSGGGVIGCLDAATGKPQWQHQMAEFGGSVPGWGYSESVLILGKMAVITPGGEHCIVALDKASGQPIWSSSGFQAGAQYSSCYAFSFQGVPMIATGTAEGIACVNAVDGQMLWANPFSAGNTANCPTPVFSDGYVFWANGYGKGGICLKLSVNGNRVGAQEAWLTRDMVCHHGGYIIHEGYVYGNNGSGWTCLDLKTGERMWQERGVGKGSVCFADEMLYLFGEVDGRAGLATCSPDGMEMRGSFSVEGEGTSWAHPVVIGGRLYLRYDSNLYCYDVRESG